MPEPLSLAEHTLAAELIERSLDDMFDDQFPENGSFATRSTAGRGGEVRKYFYYMGYRPGLESTEASARYSKYVGPADDPAIVERVARFREIKARRREQTRLTHALAAAGLPRPPIAMGRVIEALARSGVFRLRAVLVGTAAFQTYPALLGMRLNQSFATTGDVDIAQFRAISLGVDDATPKLIEVLRSVDPTFREVPPQQPADPPSRFVSLSGFRLDVLTPHRGGDDEMGAPLRLNSLGGVGGQPLRFLDFLIRQPQRSVVLYGPGVSVNVPAPARFAVHKLIVAIRRHVDGIGQAKARKDLAQASELFLAMAQSGRLGELEDAWREAWQRGPAWRAALSKAAPGLSPEARQVAENWFA